MRILLVAATHFEIEGILMQLSVIQENNPDFEGDFLVTGAGIFQTAYQLGKRLAEMEYDLAVNVGIAGSFDRSLPPGSVVVVERDTFADFGAENGPGFLSAAELGLEQPDDPPYAGGWLVSTPVKVGPVLEGLPRVTGITVNTVHGNAASIKKVVDRLHPAVESMEGAAFLYACLDHGLPCLQIRAISNFVERRNKKAWNIPLAIENLAGITGEVLTGLRPGPRLS